MNISIGKDGRTRAYGAGTIKRVIQSQKRDYGKDAHTSIADKPHSHSKQAARLRRQMERKAAKDAQK